MSHKAKSVPPVGWLVKIEKLMVSRSTNLVVSEILPPCSPTPSAVKTVLYSINYKGTLVNIYRSTLNCPYKVEPIRGRWSIAGLREQQL